MALQLQSLLGLIVLPLIAWALSERRGAMTPAVLARTLATGLALQMAIAAIVLWVPAARAVFDWPSRGVDALQGATNAGMRLVFGHLAGGPAPYDATHPEHAFVLAFQALPMILLVSVLTKLLYHWGLLQPVVRGFARVLSRAMGVSGPVGTSAAANVVFGMVEAPLFVKPYLVHMSRGELFATMTAGMAGIAGTVLALYAAILEPKVPGAAGHLIVASIISVPAALLISALMVPYDTAAVSSVAGEISPAAAVVVADPLHPEMIDPSAPQSTMDAVAQGTREGVDLLVAVTAMLIVAVALVTLANSALELLGRPFGLAPTLQAILGYVGAPLAWLIGIPLAEAPAAGGLLGVKTVLNEFIAFLDLAKAGPEVFSPRSRLILTYALAGFANFGSLGIMLGGLTAMVPERRADILSLGPKTIIAGTLATLMTAAVVGVLTPG